jgi:GntR family transcriptional repressor for pyruvate dehydrogenase complex
MKSISAGKHAAVDEREGLATAASSERLYRELAQKLAKLIDDGAYPVGERLPAERELATQFDVSRPTVREALIALEVQGLVEIRLGSGAYVRARSSSQQKPGFDVTAFEHTEARMLIEGEVAALAATQINSEEIQELERLLHAIEIDQPSRREEADRQFHLAIARASRNLALVHAVESLWATRQSSPACALLLEKARSADVKPVIEERRAIVEALRAQDPIAARTAMRNHLNAVLEQLLFTMEEDAIQRAREASERARARVRKL